ncbi:MAG: hypothetical protein A2X28_03660 [Elusimicrobia bacterium GWA2_56_46]|nr:MAG: hypothetical protein A2X28_03660 [Elusimicrobia bacterium GWA2_56_46]OGR54971.1 MAG: hypothetical protein A2X39_02595 [Elusimicrobia bacterium GWC2_56_31]HBB67796.1 hypothetical protein [Elusimicrobiota bacterium]HBW24019.1 hypothetical protein [Elusimicrobiota bacterium]
MKKQVLIRLAILFMGSVAASPGAAAGPVFVSSESPHFIFHYVKDSAAGREMAAIAANRERAYAAISAALGEAPGGRIDITFYPDRGSTPSGFGEGSTSGDSISAVYFDFSPCYEKISYGHELAHALSFRLLGGRHSVPLLAEGMAEYLDQSGRDLHEWLSYKSRILGYQSRFSVENADLAYGNDLSSLSYTKAGSFVKFLVEAAGWKKFMELYAATRELGRLHPDERLERFGEKFKEIYGRPLENAEAGWNKAAAPFQAKDLPRLPAPDEAEVRKLFSSQDAAVIKSDAQAFSLTYDRIGRKRIRYFDGNLKFYMEKLLETQVNEIYDLGVKNGRRALVRATRRFKDLTTRKIAYYVEKLEDGWKIQNEEWR